MDYSILSDNSPKLTAEEQQALDLLIDFIMKAASDHLLNSSQNAYLVSSDKRA